MIYLVHEFIMGQWFATIGAYKQLYTASSTIEQIMEDEGLEQKEFFTEGGPIFTEYWFITNGGKTFMIQTTKLIWPLWEFFKDEELTDDYSSSVIFMLSKCPVNFNKKLKWTIRPL